MWTQGCPTLDFGGEERDDEAEVARESAEKKRGVGRTHDGNAAPSAATELTQHQQVLLFGTTCLVRHRLLSFYSLSSLSRSFTRSWLDQRNCWLLLGCLTDCSRCGGCSLGGRLRVGGCTPKDAPRSGVARRTASACPTLCCSLRLKAPKICTPMLCVDSLLWWKNSL